MNRELQLIVFVAGVAAGCVLIGMREFVLGAGLLATGIVATTIVQMFEHHTNAKAWTRHDDIDEDDEP